MNNKQVKKMRRIVKQNQRQLETHVVNDFFDMVRELKLKYRIKLAWFILIKKKIR